MLLVGAFALAPAGASERGPGSPAAADPKRGDLRDRLQRRLADLASALQGASGYVIRDLTTGETFERNAETVFPAASLIKVPIYLELLRQSEEGLIDLEAPLGVDPKARVEGGGVLEKWSEPYPVLTAGQLAVLMIDFSDNYATNLLLDRLGIDRVAKRLRSWGLTETRLRRKMMDLDAARAGRENVSTPRDMGGLFARLARGEVLGAAETAEAIAVLKRDEKTPMKRGLPEGIEVADKDGELGGVRCDAGIVFVKAEGVQRPAVHPLVVAVMTAYLEDEAEGEAFIGALTRSAFEYVKTLQSSTEYGRRLGP